MLKKTIPSFCLLLFCFVLITGCAGNENNVPELETETAASLSYPAAPGFNRAASDSMAIVLANKVMEAMGGYQSWKDTRYIAWTFLGRRRLIWDKHTGDVRINSLTDSLKIMMNIHSMKGKVMKNGEVVTNSDSLQKYLEIGKHIWINDSYWLVMPFKMKDSGVTLTYLGEDSTRAGEGAHLVQLTFENVGVTPQNKFHVWVDKDTHLVTQWAYFRKASQDEPNFVMPWNDYKKYGEILLSGDHGKFQLSNIVVLDKLPERVFTTFEEVDLSTYKAES